MTPVDVVTIWAPRPAHPNWRDGYLSMLRVQKATAEHCGHRHIVVTDQPGGLPGFNCIAGALPDELMPAMVAGVAEYLRIAPKDRHIVFVDADCIIARPLGPAFDGSFDLGLTRRVDPVAPINNGAMYVANGAIERAAVFFKTATYLCGTHWGADQEIISRMVAPVPLGEGVHMRDDLAVAFLSMRTHGVVPKQRGLRHYSDPFVVHFKGDTKEWAQTYADKFVLNATFEDAA